jgi:hypothetical protein
MTVKESLFNKLLVFPPDPMTDHSRDNSSSKSARGIFRLHSRRLDACGHALYRHKLINAFLRADKRPPQRNSLEGG